MKKRQDESARGFALRITLSVALTCITAILLSSNFKAGANGNQATVAQPTLGNYPDTAMPLSTDTTVTPDAAPINTTSINVSTSTDFKGKLEGYPDTGVVRVTDAHPAGTYTVTVTAFDSGGATTTKTFSLTVTTPVTCNPVSFAAATNFAAGSNPFSVAVGDFDGDGKQDLALADLTSNDVSILLGNGDGTFSAPTNFAAGTAPESAAVGDFNGDGKQDLAVANAFSNDVSILLGNGDGTFSGPTNFAAGVSPISVAVGDFNSDGKRDLAVANQNTNDVSILLGNGDGTFSAATNFAAGSSPFSVAVGDFNSDGKRDLAVANLSSDNVSILLGNGDGTFSAATNFAAGAQPGSVAVGDFNSDGKQDLAVSNQSSNNVSILLGNGDGTFTGPTNFAAGTGPYSAAVGDFNGDAKQDLAVSNQSSNNVSILLGNGDGTFSAPTNFAVGVSPTSVAVGDFNGDAKQDLAVANNGSDNVSILLRDCAQTPTPTPSPTPTPTPTPAQVSQLTTTGTTCKDFVGNTAKNISTIEYNVKAGTIRQPAPGGFFYWVKVTAAAGSNTFVVDQTITTGNFSTLFALTSGSSVFNGNCKQLQGATFTQSSTNGTTGTITVMFNAPTAGTYYIAVKLNTANLNMQPAPTPSTVGYSFDTAGVPGSTSSLNLVKK